MNTEEFSDIEFANPNTANIVKEYNNELYNIIDRIAKSTRGETKLKIDFPCGSIMIYVNTTPHIQDEDDYCSF